MILEGTVTNVTNFGAFVDIGVHQDGLVHISCLADKFVDDPHKVVKAGQIVKVKVLEIDIQRKRIALTMKLQDATQQHSRPSDDRSEKRPPDKKQYSNKSKNNHVKTANTQNRTKHQGKTNTNNAMAAKLAAAFNK